MATQPRIQDDVARQRLWRCPRRSHQAHATRCSARSPANIRCFQSTAGQISACRSTIRRRPRMRRRSERRSKRRQDARRHEPKLTSRRGEALFKSPFWRDRICRRFAGGPGSGSRQVRSCLAPEPAYDLRAAKRWAWNRVASGQSPGCASMLAGLASAARTLAARRSLPSIIATPATMNRNTLSRKNPAKPLPVSLRT